MKKCLQTAFALVILLAALTPTVSAQDNLNYYWSGSGNADWHTLTNWQVRDMSGVLVAATELPDATNNVYFTKDAFTGSSTVTMNGVTTGTVESIASAKSIDFTGVDAAVTLSINMPLVIAGSLTLTSLVNFDLNATGSITFTSTDEVTITSANKTIPVPVTFNGVNGSWTLQDNMTVSKEVTFTNGYVIAPAYDATTLNNSRMLILEGPAAKPVGASNSSHVIGYVQKKGLAGTMVMPVGAGSGMYRPVTATVKSVSDDVVAKYFNADPNSNPDPSLDRNHILPVSNSNSLPQLQSVSDREYWYVSSDKTAGIEIDLDYNRPNRAGETPSSEDYYFMNDPWRWKSLTVAAWKKNGGWSDVNLFQETIVNPEKRIIKSAGSPSQAAYFTIGSRGNTPLPVRLISFTAQYLDGQVQLKWQSVSEENSSLFVVEKSQDGRSFSSVLARKAQGNATSLVAYSAYDNSPYSGTSYYRLKMVDQDGSFEYSNMATVSGEGSQLQVRAYPNPSNGKEIRLVALNGHKLVLQSVMDVFGKVVQYEMVNLYAGEVYVNFFHPLPAGLYVASVITDDDKRERIQIKLVVQ